MTTTAVEPTTKTVTERDTTKTCSGLPAPDGWHVLEPWGDGLVWQRLTGQAIKVIEDISVKADGKQWLHVSISKPNKKMPTYDDIQVARKLFIGEHRECYQIIPTQDRYVNFFNVLHLWCCLDAPDGVLPHMEDIVTLDGREVLSI
jgi:hypothetical protein